MTVLLKQVKDMFVALFGIACLILVLVLLIIIIVLKKAVLQSWHGLVVRAKSMWRNPFSPAGSRLEQTKY